MSKKLKVFHFQLLPLLSGVQNVSLNEIKFLNKEFEFEVGCSYSGPFSHEISKMGLKTHFFKDLKHTISIKSDIKVFFHLLSFFNHNKYDIVHTHSSKPGILGRITAKISGCNKVIHTVHGFAFGSSSNFIKKLLFFILEFIAARFTDIILVMNKSDFEFCKKRLLIPEKKIVFLSNGIQDKLFNTDIEDKRVLINDESLINVVFIGRLSIQKNPKLLIEAFNNLPLEVKDKAKLHFIGDGELFPELNKRVEELNLKDKVLFHGWIENAVNYIHEFDIFVLPSIYEGMPLSIIEAMASNVAVIASDISGNNDLIENNISGKLFKSDNINDLKSVLNELIVDDNKRNELSKKGFLKANKNYRLSLHCEILSDLYKNIS